MAKGKENTADAQAIPNLVQQFFQALVTDVRFRVVFVEHGALP